MMKSFHKRRIIYSICILIWMFGYVFYLYNKTGLMASGDELQTMDYLDNLIKLKTIEIHWELVSKTLCIGCAIIYFKFGESKKEKYIMTSILLLMLLLNRLSDIIATHTTQMFIM